MHIARDVDADGHWFYHDPASGDPATFSLPGGEVLEVDLKQNPKNTSIPPENGKWCSARRGLRIGNTMGHSIDHLLPGIYANKFEGAKNPRVTSNGEPIKILKVLGLVPVAGEMSQNVFALSDEQGTWKVVGNSPEGYPILEETIVRTNDGIEKTFQKKWQ